jgi:hypothetical protein
MSRPFAGISGNMLYAPSLAQLEARRTPTYRPRRGHIWATNDRIAADNTGHHRADKAQLAKQARPSAAGRRALDPWIISIVVAAVLVMIAASLTGGRRGRAI